MATSTNPYAPSSQKPKTAIAGAYEVLETLESTEPLVEPQIVPEGSAAEVLEWVGEDKDRAREALAVEDAGQQRIGLSRKLKELAE